MIINMFIAQVYKLCHLLSVAFGVLLWELFTQGNVPYHGVSKEEVPLLLEKGDRLQCPTGCPVPLRDLMRHCWEWEPENRPTFTEVSTSLSSLSEGNNKSYVVQSLSEDKNFQFSNLHINLS